MKEAVTRNAVPQLRDEAGLSNAQQRPGFPLRSLCSLQDGNENRGQFFALTRVLPNARPFGLPVYVASVPTAPFLSQRRELFYADNPRFLEEFQPVGALTRCFPGSSPATSRV
jgi:hypothetical protein